MRFKNIEISLFSLWDHNLISNILLIKIIGSPKYKDIKDTSILKEILKKNLYIIRVLSISSKVIKITINTELIEFSFLEKLLCY